jgi:hypothetical protein
MALDFGFLLDKFTFIEMHEWKGLEILVFRAFFVDIYI